MRKVLKKMVWIGDVIMSPDFIACWRFEAGRSWVGRNFGGNSSDDPARADALYVVEDVIFVPATEGTQECWQIAARRLNADGGYDTAGEAIAFYMESDYTTPFIEEVAVVGKLKRVITFVAQD